MPENMLHIIGVTVGTSTIDDAEAKLGTGLPVTGAHPQGGRLWTSADQKCFVMADGFEYKRSARHISSPIVEHFFISSSNPHPDRWRGAKKLKIKCGEIRFLNRICLGDTTTSVLSHLQRRGMQYTHNKKEQWITVRDPRIHIRDDKTREAELCFQNDRLSCFNIYYL